jgi:hypothetical protein
MKNLTRKQKDTIDSFIKDEIFNAIDDVADYDGNLQMAALAYLIERLKNIQEL